MSIDRRESGQSRRRRVLYQATRDSTPETAAERRSAERLREARRPTASYGSHVNRRLRGRWFSLVPVSRMAMSLSGAVVFGSALLLTLLHFAAVTWPPLAYNEELARPFRLDRSDSFGSWARAFFLAAGSATALLVYQLRRYKVDDYTGSYRIWRSVLVLVAILSIDSVCHLVPWFGALVDISLGKRMALSGADWIRIVLTVGGGALALRLIAEVRRSRLALAMTLVALVAFAIPLLSHWKLIDTSQMRGWIMSTSSPLIASAALWISFGAYLRMLFREVRGLDLEIVATKQEILEAKKTTKLEVEEASTSRGWFRRRAEAPKEKTLLKSSKPRLVASPKTAIAQTEVKEPQGAPDTKTKRSWFAFAKSKNRAEGTSQTVTEKSKLVSAKPIEATKPVVVEKSIAAETHVRKVDSPTSKQESVATVKRSWFSFGRKKSASVNPEKSAGMAPVASPAKPVPVATKAMPAASETKAESEKPARKGLGSWLRRDSAEKQVVPEANSKPPAASKPATTSTDADDDDEDDVSDDSVDWGSMNKSERRRMRKEMKRSGRAA